MSSRKMLRRAKQRLASSATSAQQAQLERELEDAVGELTEWSNFVVANCHLLARRPDLAFQLALNHLKGSAPEAAARQMAKAGRGRVPASWVEWKNKPAAQALAHHSRSSSSGSSSAALCIAWEPSGQQLIAVGYANATLKIMELPGLSCRYILSGHRASVSRPHCALH